MNSPLTLPEEFPPTNKITHDCYSAKIISSAYSSSTGELNSILQYIYHSMILDAYGYKQFAKDVESIAIAEMLHLKLLGKTLIALGVQPMYSQNPSVAFNFYSTKFVCYSCNVKFMIEDDIRLEKLAISGYDKMINLLKNDDVKSIIVRINADEKLHLEKFEEILYKLKG